MKKYDVCGCLAAMEIFSHGATYPPSEYPPAEGRPVGAAMGGASCVTGAMRGEPRSGGPAWQNSVTPSLRVRKTMSGGS